MKIWLFIQNTLIPLEETNSQRGASGSFPSPVQQEPGRDWVLERRGLGRGRQLGRMSHLPDTFLPDQI